MIKKLLHPNIENFPKVFHNLFTGAEVYDSSCSENAKVYYIDRSCGYYLKKATKGSLSKEVMLTRYFHKKGLATEVLEYITSDFDWMLTARVPGEDCTAQVYLDDPLRLCDTLGEVLRQLHEESACGCPIPERTADYIKTALQNYEKGIYDALRFGYSSPEEALGVIEKHKDLLRTDTLIHGDFCLPNIMLENWRFSKFIDLDSAGISDRHIDLFWGAWSLGYNLKTEKYRDRFFDAYGKDKIDPDMLRVIAAFEVFG
ncbi:MAG: aminoglycoside 3'-phosphotransferase [Ruminococcaceae bacterium]|nr:aminoglycoside 3'-phosphotransferase [Oscillospiraceae bacterium]